MREASRGLNSLALSLADGSPLAALDGPWEVRDGDDEEGVAVIRNTSQRIIPRQKRSEQSKVSAGLDQVRIGVSLGISLEVADEQEQEGEIEGEEEQEEGDSGTQRADQQDGGEDEPAREEEAKGVVEVVGVRGGRLVCCYNAEAAGGEHDADGDPETTVGGESSGTKGVSYSHFPHASEQLNESSISES